MYESFYGLKEKPFRIVPNPEILFMGAKYQNALTYLEYGLMEDAGFILLTGEIGTGKTTLIRYILNRFCADMDVAVIFNTNVSPDQLVSLILQSLELEYKDGAKAKNLDTLHRFLIKRYAQNKRVLIIIDEAQNLSHAAMEEVRMLSNLQSDDQILIQIMLAGQPELRKKLKHPDFTPFTQRIAVNFRLSALTREEAGNYIAFRLEKAGGQADIFSQAAVDKIYQASGGVPRAINLLCDASLVYGFGYEIESIDESVIQQVIMDKGDIGLQPDEVPEADEHPLNADAISGSTEDVFNRLASLEADLRKIDVRIDWQVKEIETQAEEARNQLVSNLKKLIHDERDRYDKLLVNYTLLNEKYKDLEKLWIQTESDNLKPGFGDQDIKNLMDRAPAWLNPRNWFSSGKQGS